MKLLTTTSVLAAIALIGVVVLIATNKAVPQELWGVVALLLGGHLGLTTPASTVTVTAATPGPQPVPGG